MNKGKHHKAAASHKRKTTSHRSHRASTAGKAQDTESQAKNQSAQEADLNQRAGYSENVATENTADEGGPLSEGLETK